MGIVEGEKPGEHLPEEEIRSQEDETADCRNEGQRHGRAERSDSAAFRSAWVRLEKFFLHRERIGQPAEGSPSVIRAAVRVLASIDGDRFCGLAPAFMAALDRTAFNRDSNL